MYENAFANHKLTDARDKTANVTNGFCDGAVCEIVPTEGWGSLQLLKIS